MLIYGTTKCPICGEVINREDDIVAFPVFAGHSSKFYVFSDSALHRQCFNEHPLKYELRAMLREAYDPPNDQQQWLLDYIDDLLAEDDTPSETTEEQTDDDPSE